MTTGQEHAEERGRVCSGKRRAQSAGIFAMVGLIAALAGGATAKAQCVVPEARTPPPGAAPAEAMPPAPPAGTPAAPGSAADTRSVTTPGTLPASTLDAETAAAAELAPAEQTTSEERPLALEEKREVTDKMAQLDMRYDQMNQERSERSNLTAPITLMSAGYATATAAMVGAMVGFVKANSIKNYDGDFESRLDYNNDDVIDGDDEDGYRRLTRTAGVISAVGFGFGIAGTVMLAKRLKERSDYEPELRQLQQERKQLRRQLDYSANATGKALTLTVSGRF